MRAVLLQHERITMCFHVCTQAKPSLRNSTVLDNKSHRPTPSKVRTSAGMFFRRGETISDGICEILTTISAQQLLQILSRSIQT